MKIFNIFKKKIWKEEKRALIGTYEGESDFDLSYGNDPSASCHRPIIEVYAVYYTCLKTGCKKVTQKEEYIDESTPF